MIKFDVKKFIKPSSIFLIIGFIVEVIAICFYFFTGVNDFNISLSIEVIVFGVISIVFGAFVLFMKVLSIDEYKNIKKYLDVVVTINYVLALFAFMYYLISQVNYLANVIVSIDGTKVSFEFIFTILLLVLAFCFNITSAVLLRRESKEEKETFGKVLFRRTFLSFITIFTILLPCLTVARANATMINRALNIKTDKIIEVGENDDIDTLYYPSQYNSLEQVTEAGEAIAEELEAGGLVLLKNDNNALPIAKNNPKVSLFGKGSVAFNYTPSLSGGSVNISNYNNMKTAL